MGYGNDLNNIYSKDALGTDQPTGGDANKDFPNMQAQDYGKWGMASQGMPLYSQYMMPPKPKPPMPPQGMGQPPMGGPPMGQAAPPGMPQTMRGLAMGPMGGMGMMGGGQPPMGGRGGY